MSVKEAWSREFLSCRNLLFKVVSGIVPPKDVEDVVQDTYVRVCQVDDFSRIRQPRSFLVRTAKNLAFDHIKRAEYRLADAFEDLGDDWEVCGPDSLDKTFSQVAAHQEFVMFCEAVRCLPVQMRRAFVLKKVYGFSQREIAEHMSLSESTVEKHIAAGIRKTALIMRAAEQVSTPIQEEA